MYEHRLFIVKRGELRSRKNPEHLSIYPEIIAEYRCSRMPQSFYDLFRNGVEIDFGLYVHDGDNETMVDCYGEHCRMVKPNAVVEYLENLMACEGEWRDYRRLPPLLGLLKGFDSDEWESPSESLWVVNYGH